MRRLKMQSPLSLLVQTVANAMIDFIKNIVEALQLPLQDPILVFSLLLLIILLAPILLQKIKTPSIIGLIVAGILIGPNGLGVLPAELIHQDSAIAWFSTIGLLYIMFIAGLELDLNEFKSHRNRSLTFGFLTFTIPLAIGYPVCRYLLGYDFNASFLTASMFATHTLVAYPIASRLGVSKNQAVAVTVGGTILTDTAVLIILAIIMGNHEGKLSTDFWVQLGISLTIFTAITFFLIPRIAAWFFRTFEGEKHSHYIFVLAIMFFAAFLSEMAGVEAIIGAFMAGLALNKHVPASSALMNRIEFLGNSFFIPFFLIGVGMMVDVSVLLGGWGTWIIAGTLTIVALFGKWAAAFAAQLIFAYSKPQRQLIFGLSGAHAAATLAIIMIGHTAGILDDNILNGTIILILITSTVASFATENASKIIAKEDEEDAESLIKASGASSEHLLIPLKVISNMDKFLEFGVLIKDKKSPNPISVLNVVSNNSEAEVNILKAKSKLEEVVKEASASETQANVLTTIEQNVAKGIARISREVMADMIILGWPHKSGFVNQLIDDHVGSILNRTYKTTFICHFEKPLAIHKKIVVAIPPFSEEEIGFPILIEKILMLAHELSTSILLYSNETTAEVVKTKLEESKATTQIDTKTFTDWEDFLILSRNVARDDLLILVSARSGARSYLKLFETLPTKLEKYFSANNYIVAYQQHAEESLL